MAPLVLGLGPQYPLSEWALELDGEMEVMKPWSWLGFGLLLVVWAFGVVAQQVEEPDPPVDRTEDCRIGVDEMERFRRSRRLTKSC